MLMVVMYARIFKVAADQESKIANEHSFQKQNKQRLKDRKYAKAMAIVLGVFFLCWVPWTTGAISSFYGYTDLFNGYQV